MKGEGRDRYTGENRIENLQPPLAVPRQGPNRKKWVGYQRLNKAIMTIVIITMMASISRSLARVAYWLLL